MIYLTIRWNCSRRQFSTDPKEPEERRQHHKTRKNKGQKNCSTCDRVRYIQPTFLFPPHFSASSFSPLFTPISTVALLSPREGDYRLFDIHPSRYDALLLHTIPQRQAQALPYTRRKIIQIRSTVIILFFSNQKGETDLEAFA